MYCSISDEIFGLMNPGFDPLVLKDTSRVSLKHGNYYVQLPNNNYA